MLTEPITISQTDLRKLLSAASPDAALLYLYIHGGNRPEDAQEALKLSQSRCQCAAATLRQLGLWTEKAPAPILAGERPS